MPYSVSPAASADGPAARSGCQAVSSATRSATTTVLPGGRPPSSAASQCQGSAV
ncbi:hypothetical protein [Streptomyces malaysiensis]|uniref:hypothetical protein n=1 Tax=Streptomyces malaysiensis TaxID=92644 RepID=UPI00202EE18E|nr:hypothetical protein [Streptomyces malaysiensis]